MKRFLVILASVLLLSAVLVTSAFATNAGGKIAASPTTATPGSTVEVIVSLYGFPQVSGVTMEYTVPAGLKLESAEWLLDGKLDDVDTNLKLAVWAPEDTANISEETPAFKLVYTVLEPQDGASLSNTVSVTYKVKHNATVLGNETLSTTVATMIPATGVTLDRTSLSLDLKTNTSAVLTATAVPGNTTDTVTWETSDAQVVTVAGGTVTAVGKGTATVTAKAGSKTATCAVTVGCSHTLTEHPANDPTCQATGNNLYYTCNLCSAVLAADQTTVTTVAEQTLPTVGHTGGTATCTTQAVCKWCSTGYGELLPHDYTSDVWQTSSTHHWHKCNNCTTEISKQTHTYQWKLDREATEDVTGLKHEECVCGLKRNENTVIPKLDHSHVGITRHAAVKATCVKAGTVEYWTCSSSKCAGKYYADAKCQLELTSITEAVNKNNHAGPMEVKDAKAATCSQAGYTGDTYCTACKALATKGSAVAATGKHTPKAGYQSDDKNHWQLCADCNTVINTAAHKLTWKTDKKATESATGLKHQECSVCSYVCSQNTVIDKLKHAPASVSGKDATCTEDGALEHFYCDSCGRYYASEDGAPGEEIQKADIVIPATGHSFGDEWFSDENGHWHTCACGATSDSEAHTTEVINAKDATETETGYTGDTVCTTCQAVVSQGREIPVLSTQPTVTDEDDTKGNSKLIVACSVLAGIAVLGGCGIAVFKKPKV